MATQVGELLATLYIKTASFERGLKAAETRLKAFAVQANAVGKTLQRWVTTPFLVAAGAATFFGSRFEAELTKIETLVGVNAQQVGRWREELLKMAPAVGKGPGELARALFVVTSAGERTERALEIVRESAKAAAIGLGDTREVARTVTAVMQAYGASNISAGEAVEVLVKTVREGNLEAQELAGSLGRVIGVAANLGVAFSEVGSFIATFTRLGVNANEAVTALRGTMNIMLKPTEQGRKAMRALGTSFEEVRNSARGRGLIRTLIDLLDRIGDNEEALGQIIPNVRALSGVLGVAGSQAEQASEISRALADSLVVVEAGFERTSKTANQKFKQALAGLEVALIRLGEIVLPVFKRITEGVIALTEKFSSLTPTVRANIVGWVALVALLGPAVRLFGLLARAGAFLATSLTTVVAAMRQLLLTLVGLRLLRDLAGAGAVASIGLRGLLKVILGPAGLVLGLVTLVTWLIKTNAVGRLAQRVFGTTAEKVRDLRTETRKLTQAERDQLKSTLENQRTRLQIFRDQNEQLKENARLEQDVARRGFATPSGRSYTQLTAAIAGYNREIEFADRFIERYNKQLEQLGLANRDAQGDFDALKDQIRALNSVVEQGGEAAANFRELFSSVAERIAQSLRENLIDAPGFQSLLHDLGTALGEAAKAGVIDDQGVKDAIQSVIDIISRLQVELKLTETEASRAGSFLRDGLRRAKAPGLGAVSIVADLRSELSRLSRLAQMAGVNTEAFTSAFAAAADDLTSAISEGGENVKDLIALMPTLAQVGRQAMDANLFGAEELVNALINLESALSVTGVTGKANMDLVTQAMSELEEVVKGLTSGAMKDFELALQRIGKITGKLKGEAFLAGFDAVFGAFRASLSNVGEDTKGVQTGVDAMVGILKTGLESGAITADQFRDRIQAIDNALIGAAAGSDALAAELPAMLETLNQVMGEAVDSTQWFEDALKDVGRGAARELARGLVEGFGNAEDMVKRALEVLLEALIIQAAKTLLMLSPSKVAMGWGHNVGAGLALGLEKSVNIVKEATGKLMEATQISAPMDLGAALAAQAVGRPAFPAVDMAMASPSFQFNMPAPDLSRLPAPLTPREASLNREWLNLFSETFRSWRSDGGKL